MKHKILSSRTFCVDFLSFLCKIVGGWGCGQKWNGVELSCLRLHHGPRHAPMPSAPEFQMQTRIYIFSKPTKLFLQSHMRHHGISHWVKNKNSICLLCFMMSGSSSQQFFKHRWQTSKGQVGVPWILKCKSELWWVPSPQWEGAILYLFLCKPYFAPIQFLKRRHTPRKENCE